MEYESSDYDTLRARVEKRLAPMNKLRRLRLWLFLNLGMFIGFMVLQSSSPDNSIFVKVIQNSGTWFNPTTGQTETWTGTGYQTYPLVIFISVVWFFLIIAHAIHIWSANRHERAIQREMERETNLELERLRLQVEMMRSERLTHADEAYTTEKAKRALQLGDDGELLPEDKPRAARRSRS